MKQMIKLFLLSILSIAVMTTGAMAAGQSSQKTSKMGAQSQGQWPNNARQLMDKEIVSPQGEELGSVDDFMIGQDGRIKYVILKSGGFIGIGEDEFTIPWNAIQAQKENQLVANISKSEIEKYTKEEKKSAEKEAEQQKQMAKSEKSQQEEGMKTAQQKQQQQQKTGKEVQGMQATRARDLLDKKVMSKDDKELGTADNIYISEEGKAMFVIVNPKEGDQLRPIPADLVHKNPQKDNLKAEIDQQTFAQAPGFSKQDKPELAKSEWEQKIRGYYGDKGQSQSGEMKKHHESKTKMEKTHKKMEQEHEHMKKEAESKMEQKSTQTQ